MELLVAVTVLCVGGCQCREPADKAPPPTPTVIAVPAPEPPRPGTAEIEATGAVTFTKKGTGSACGFGKRIGSQDLEGFDVKPTWAFWVNENAKGAKLASAELTLDETSYEWTGDGARFLPYDGPQEIWFDEELKSKTGAKVRLRAHITCPSYPITVVPNQVTAILANHTGLKPRGYSTFDFGRARYPAAASVLLPQARALTALAAIRAELPPGYVAYVGTDQFLGDEHPAVGDVELVIAPGADQFDIIRTARTDAVNFDIRTEAIIKQLVRWDRAYGIDIVLASTDTVVFKLRNRPVDLDAFAKEVYAFCPDVVDQGAGTLTALAKQIGGRGEVSLWWD